MLEIFIIIAFAIGLIVTSNGRRIFAWAASNLSDVNRLDDDLYDLILKDVDAGLISARPHPDDKELIIYNYTPQVAYDKLWDEATRLCRGLILRGQIIVSRSFTKFFNVGELEELPTGPFRVFEKYDGSLGIGYLAPDKRPAIATRGSFASKQAEFATGWLRDRPELEAAVTDCLANNCTPLFEIIYPENRIVLDYGDTEDLVLLATIDNETGLDLEVDFWPGTTVEEYFHLNITVEQLASKAQTNKEGFVVLYEDGTRVKQKFEEYVRLHHILTGVTPRKIWKLLYENMGIKQLKESVPDEFYVWMENIVNELETEYSEIEKAALASFEKVPRKLPEVTDEYGLTVEQEHDPAALRKLQAEFIKTQVNPGILFMMLDGKPYREVIWKMVYPSGDFTFRVDPDA